MSESLERLGRNQALFRESTNGSRRPPATRGSGVVCERSNTDCIGDWFVIEPDHDIPNIERIISQDDGYAVDERFVAASHAEATDPRSDERSGPFERINAHAGGG